MSYDEIAAKSVEGYNSERTAQSRNSEHNTCCPPEHKDHFQLIGRRCARRMKKSLLPALEIASTSSWSVPERIDTRTISPSSSFTASQNSWEKKISVKVVTWKPLAMRAGPRVYTTVGGQFKGGDAQTLVIAAPHCRKQKFFCHQAYAWLVNTKMSAHKERKFCLISTSLTNSELSRCVGR